MGIIKKKESSKKKTDNKPKKKSQHIERFDMKNALPFTFDEEKHLFVDNEGKYMKMVRTHGTNLFGFKEVDQYSYVRALTNIFTPSIGAGQIFSYQVSADIDGYVEDFQFFMDRLDLRYDQNVLRYEIMENAQRRMKYTSITRELVDRCFVFVLKDKDIMRLEQRCNEIVATIVNYQYTYILNWFEQFEVLFNYYHPRNAKLFTELAREVTDVMDFLYPTRIGMVGKNYKKCLELDGLYTRTKYISSYKKSPEFAMMCYLATMGADIDFSLHFEPAPADSITKEMNKEMKNLKQNREQSKEPSEQSIIEKKQNQLRDMIDEVAAQGASPYLFTVVLRLKAETMEELNELSSDLDKQFTGMGMQFRDGVFEPLELFNMAAPICRNELPNYAKATTTDTLGFMYPFVFETLYDSTEVVSNGKVLCRYPPVYIGNTIQTNGVVFYDNFQKLEDRSNYNEFICGSSGRGKTFFLMMLIYYRFAIGYRQYIIDVEGKELNKLTYYLKGENFNCADGSKGRINPLQVRINIPDSDDGEEKIPLSEIYPLAQHIRFLRAFFQAYKGNSNEIGLLHDNMIENALLEVYAEHGITLATSAEYIVENFGNDDYPVMLDVYNRLEEKLDSLKKSNDPTDIKEIDRVRICLAFLEPLAKGADANLFNGPTNIDLKNKLICFNISALHDNSDSRVLKTQYYNILSYIWTDVISNKDDSRIQIYNDEFHIAMDPRFPDIMAFFKNTTKRDRKYNCGLTTATQQISDVLKKSVREDGEAIIENSTYQFYFGLGAEGISYFDNNKLLPESEKEFITFAKIGECYARIGSATAMRVRINADEETEELLKRMKDK